jgi:hypothetical protein
MSAYIIAAIFLLLILIAGYLFLSHSIEKRRAQRLRLITALRARRNSFRDLATAFPAGFLSNDLTSLLYRALVDCCEQLGRLEPNDPVHSEQLSLYSNLLASQKDTSQQQRVRLDNPQQIKEAHNLLQELYKFVLQQSALKQINQLQTETYKDQINRLVLKISVDKHVFNARQAQQAGKVKLTMHHYALARKTLTDENSGRGFEKQIAQLDVVIAKLKEKATATTEDESNAPAPTSTEPADKSASKEWQQFDEENDKWRKKQIYD